MNRHGRVLYLNHSMQVGGIEVLIHEVARRMNNEGSSAAVCVFQGGGSLEEKLSSDGIELYNLEKHEGLDVSVVTRLRKLLVHKGVDVLHTNNFSAWLYGGLASIGLHGLKLVHTEHSNVDKRRRAWAEKFLSYFTDRIVCVSEDVSRSMIQRQRISCNRVQVIHNGVDTDKFSPNPRTRRAYRERLNIGQDVPVIGIVARLASVKDHSTLLDAYSKVAKKLPESCLLIIGYGELRERLLNQANELGLGRNVLFLGERQDVAELLTTLDVFVLPSISEGHNISLIEAMSTGIPVIATDVGGNGEIVINDVTGYLVPCKNAEVLADRMEFLLSHDELLLEMSKRGRRRALDIFSIERMIEQYRAIYREACFH